MGRACKHTHKQPGLGGPRGRGQNHLQVEALRLLNSTEDPCPVMLVFVGVFWEQRDRGDLSSNLH